MSETKKTILVAAVTSAVTVIILAFMMHMCCGTGCGKARGHCGQYVTSCCVGHHHGGCADKKACCKKDKKACKGKEDKQEETETAEEPEVTVVE